MTVVLVVLGLAVALAIVMALAWAVVLRTGKSGWTDTFWSAGIGIVGVAGALLPLSPGDPTARALLVAALVALWSFRLALHIGRRTVRGVDDPRYAKLREEWGDRYRSQLFIFLQVQAAAALVLVVAVLTAAHNPAPLGFFDIVGALIALGAIAGEAVSDRQLRAFAADPANKGQVCDVGLWSLSRHPNYFFEWLYWLAYVFIGISLPGYGWGLVTFAAPALMYWLLVHISGIPLLEAHMLSSRGDAFRAYQARVRPFWPLPRLSGT